MHPNNIYSSATNTLRQNSKNYQSLPLPSLDLRSHKSFTMFYFALIFIKPVSEKHFWIWIVLNASINTFPLKQKLHFYLPLLYYFLTHEVLFSASCTTSCSVCSLFLRTAKRMHSWDNSSQELHCYCHCSQPQPTLKVGNLSPFHFML